MNVERLIRTWSLIVAGVVLGGIFFAVSVARGDSVGRASIAFAIVAGYALVVSIFRGRSETASAIGGLPVDERWQAISLRGMAASGQIGAFVALGGFIVSEASGHDGMQFALVAAAIGLGCIGSIIVLRWRL
jgi:hypothetical protein